MSMKNSFFSCAEMSCHLAAAGSGADLLSLEDGSPLRRPALRPLLGSFALGAVHAVPARDALGHVAGVRTETLRRACLDGKDAVLVQNGLGASAAGVAELLLHGALALAVGIEAELHRKGGFRVCVDESRDAFPAALEILEASALQDLLEAWLLLPGGRRGQTEHKDQRGE